MLKRRRVTLEQTLVALHQYELVPIRLVTVDLVESLRIANRLTLYAYDAYLLRCALQYHAPLLTLDRSLASKARLIGVEIVEV
jgi:predicted nucleic acid-binding protein